MRAMRLTGMALAFGMVAACSPTPQLDDTGSEEVDMSGPPIAATHAHQVVSPSGASREDPYYWLRDDSRQNPEVIAYLDAENAYADTVVAPLRDTRETLYE